MKKFLTLMLVLMMILVMCSCGDNSTSETTTTTNSANNNVDSTEITNSSTSSSTSDTEENGFVGTWIHKRTDDEPFSMTLTLNADGTGTSGNTNVEWCMEAENRISVVLVYSADDKGNTTYASLTEENKLCWENDINIKTSTGDILELDEIIFERQ